MRFFFAFALLVTLCTGCFAGDIRKGAVVQVKADSVWFEKAAGLTEWQKRKKNDDPAAFASYQEQLLSRRGAWQFIGPQTVKVLKFWPRDNQARIEMRTSSARLVGSRWFVDADALAR